MKLQLIIIFLLIHLANNTTIAVRYPVFNIKEQVAPILDCNYTFDEAVKGLEIPKSKLKQLTLIEVEYYSFDSKLHKGQVLINKKAVKDVTEIFQIVKDTRFPIAKVIPVIKYNWSDQESMNDNNTSAFNYRKVKGQKVLSAHSYGLAIDINPLQNPHIKSNSVQPPKGIYDKGKLGTILRDSKLVTEFRKRGWQWGGSWRSSKDYQHFEKKN
jgi:hypothetical protein